MRWSAGVGLALVLSGLNSSPVAAQDEDGAGLPAFRPSAYGKKLVTGDESAPARRTGRRRGASPTASATRPARARAVRRARRRGARGALLGESSEGHLLTQPDYGGLDASEGISGYRAVSGRPFIQGASDASAAAVNDVKQGRLGDCYFLASLAAVARSNPGLLEGMITTNGDGTYTVRLFELPFEAAWTLPHAYGLDLPETSRFRDVVVDAEFPVTQGGSPAFARSGDREGPERELWVMLAEKAYAKLKGDYEDIGEGGIGGLALNAITGGGSERHSFGLGSAEALDRRLRQALADGRPTVLGSDKHLFDDERLPGNVVQGHVYALIGVRGDRFQLYNPWGVDHPDGMTAAELKESFLSLDIGGSP